MKKIERKRERKSKSEREIIETKSLLERLVGIASRKLRVSNA